MSRKLLNSLVIGLVGVTAWGQQEADRYQTLPDRTGTGMGMDYVAIPSEMYAGIADELGLDDAQRQQWEDIRAGQRERMREMWTRMREARQAQQYGGAERGGGGMYVDHGSGMGMSSALDQLEPVLREDQVAKLWAVQDRMQERMQGRMGSRGGDHASEARAIRALPDELDLDEEQRGELDRILAGQREQMRGRWSEMRTQFEALRAARENGDEEAVAELRQQLEESRRGPEGMYEAVVEQLQKVLSAEQKERLAAMRGLTGEGEDKRRDPRDVRVVLRVVRGVKLSGTQKEEIGDIQREAIRSWREIGRRDKEGQARLAVEVKSEIGALLDGEQAEQFERLLQRSIRRGR